MSEVSRIWTVGGKRPLNPVFIAEECERNNWPMDWLGVVNGLRVPRGRRYGQANFLLSNESLQALDLSAPIDIQCVHENGTTLWPGWYVIRTEVATRDKESPAHWVVLADRRWIFERTGAPHRFNLRRDIGTGLDAYVASTINGSVPYTWQEILNSLWAELPASIAGTAPTLPSAPASTPENFDFSGLSAWQAINQVLTAIGMAVVFNATSATFTYVDLQATQSGLAELRASAISFRLWDFRPEEPTKNVYPQQVQVSYEWIPGSGESPWLEDAATEVATVDAGGFPGLKWPISDTMFAWDDNAADRAVRAGEIAGAIKGLLKPLARPWGTVYAGVRPFGCGSEVTEVEWRSDGEKGTCTVVRHSYSEIDWPKLPTIFGGTGGGGGSRIRFKIVDVICYGTSISQVFAEVTHYTGPCNTDPPGMDPYTGYVELEDTCVLEYYTVDFLTGATSGTPATGSATYFYPTGSCEGVWLIDSICGSPECND